MTTEIKELTLADLYRIEKVGISRDVADKELFGLIALAQEALVVREMKKYSLAMYCTDQCGKSRVFAGFTNEAGNMAEADGIGVRLAKERFPVNSGYADHRCVSCKVRPLMKK